MSTLHPESQYYLHTNGSVIYNPHGGVDVSSDFVVRAWNANTIGRTPKEFLLWLMEIADLGAAHERIRELWDKNELTEFVGKDTETEFFRKLSLPIPEVRSNG